MLQQIKISNFRCFRDLDVSFAPLTVLIGPNNTGKTALLSAISLCRSQSEFLLQNSRQGRDIKLKVLDTDCWQLDENNPPKIWEKFEMHEFGIEASRPNPDEVLTWSPISSIPKLPSVSYFQTPSLELSMNSQGVAENQLESFAVHDSASNVPALLDLLLRKHRTRFNRVVDTLGQLIPGFSDLNIETPTPESRRVDLVLDDGIVLDAQYVSFGVKLLIFFVAIANHPQPPGIMLIEEPETGVHPKRLNDIIKLLRGLSKAEHAENKTQIILTTHSPYLLDCINLENEQVLVFERQQDGSRNARPVEKKKLKPFLDDFMLGEVWMNEEENGLVGREI